VKPRSFQYERPEAIPAALELLSSAADRAKVLAGGQSLVALMNLRLASPEVVVDIGRLDELRYVRDDGSSLNVGALTTQATIEHDPSVATACPLLAEAVRHIGHGAIRNRGTIGGSIAHADPAAELPLVLTTLGGEVSVASTAGSRRIGAAELFQGFLMTAVRPEEIITEVSFPSPDGRSKFGFEEFAQRPGDFALVAVACQVQRDEDSVAFARVALGGVGSVPVVVDGLDGLGGADDEEVVKTVVEAVSDVSPISDIHGSADYRRHLVRRLTERAIRRILRQGV
jgi:2-furoyl-CoA dehydrogenase FAD binding subunit